MSTEKKNVDKTVDTIDKVAKIACFAIMGVYFVLLIFGGLMFGNASTFYRSLNIFSGAGDPNRIIRTISLIIFMLSASWLLRFVLKKIMFLFKHGKAFINLLISLIKYLAVIILVFLILETFGVNPTAILAGAGILSLVIGLGAQPLIEDIIAGLFIIFENVFDVGDIIVIDDYRGTVQEIGIRTTKIVDTGGNVKVVNNSDIKNLVNMSSELSLAVSDVQIEYDQSIEEVEKIIYANLDAIKEAIPLAQGKIRYVGVSELGASGVSLRFFANCKEKDIFQVQRDLNRQLKLLFDKNGINIPFTQIVLHTADKKEDKK